MNSIEYVAQILKSEGVEWMSCYPSNPLIEAVAKEGIRPVAFRHERGAVMAADGYSRVGDRKRIGVVAMQSQAGAENSVGGLAQANADNVPILVLPGGNPLNMVFVRPNFVAAKTWESVTKQVEFISRPDQTGTVMRRAFHALRSGRPGPVAVEMPVDVCMADIPDNAAEYTSPAPAVAMPSPGAIADAAAKLVAAKEPLLWAGAGVMTASATEELRTLAELLDAPVFHHHARQVRIRRAASPFSRRRRLQRDRPGTAMAQGLRCPVCRRRIPHHLALCPARAPRQVPHPRRGQRGRDQQGHRRRHRPPQATLA